MQWNNNNNDNGNDNDNDDNDNNDNNNDNNNNNNDIKTQLLPTYVSIKIFFSVKLFTGQPNIYSKDMFTYIIKTF